MDQPKISYSLVSGTSIFSRTFICHYMKGHGFIMGNEKITTPPKIKRIDTKQWWALENVPSASSMVSFWVSIRLISGPGTWKSPHLKSGTSSDIWTSEPSFSGAKHVNRPGIFHLNYHLMGGGIGVPTNLPNRGMALAWAFWPRRACCQLWRSWAWPPSATPKRPRPTMWTTGQILLQQTVVFFAPWKVIYMAKHWQAGKNSYTIWMKRVDIDFISYICKLMDGDSQHQCDEVVWADPRDSSHGWVGFFPVFFFVGKKHVRHIWNFFSPQQSAASSNPIPGLRFDKEAHRGQEGNGSPARWYTPGVHLRK